MTAKIGIIAEHKTGEGRIPLTPPQIKKILRENEDLQIMVQPSEQRAFHDQEFRSLGIELSRDLGDANLVMAVKEIDIKDIHPHQAYLYFSHTIKGQSYNMPMLKHILEVEATLIDYELISDDEDRRLVFFGRHAGLAGMVNSLWSYGQRMQVLGVRSPFMKIKQAREYQDLQDIEASLAALVPEISNWMADKPALIVGISGYGNVSKGAQHILEILNPVEISAGALLNNDLSQYQGRLVKVIFKEEDMFEPRDADRPFDLQEYFKQPELYQSKFYPYLKQLNILVNCIYWTSDCPRLITLEEIKAHYQSQASLVVVGDITCDIDGSIQFNVGSTLSPDPVYVYDPENGTKTMGFSGTGPLLMAVDNLPAELPREASEAFGEALMPFVAAMGTCDYQRPFPELELPPEIKKAVIAHAGQLTPNHVDLEQFLKV